jgi:hypothetical protein
MSDDADDPGRLAALTARLLDESQPVHTLHLPLTQLGELLRRDSQPIAVPQRDIAGGETRTANGLAISPQMASMCLDDFARTIVFLRAIDDAIRDLLPDVDGRPLRVLYAGCGPFATLALPLMTQWSDDLVRFTLLDIHAESIASASAAVERFGLADSVMGYVLGDAGTHEIDPADAPDLIVLEAMQSCLSAEPQVALARHLMRQAPAAVLVPERVTVRLDLVDLSKEFSLTDPERPDEVVSRDRHSLGEVFRLDRESIPAWPPTAVNALPAASIRMPLDWDRRYQPMLFTEVIAYRNHVLGDYDSGLTCPRAPFVDGALEPGAVIRFTYELGHQPRLAGCVRPAGAGS